MSYEPPIEQPGASEIQQMEDAQVRTSNPWRFIHIPKTGGTSFISTYGIGDYSHIHHHTTGPDFDFKVFKLRERVNAACYEETISKISFIRHPLDRLVSCVGYILRNDPEVKEQGLVPRKFMIFCEEHLFGEKVGLLGIGSEYHIDLKMTDPQIYWIGNQHHLMRLETVTNKITSNPLFHTCCRLGIPFRFLPSIRVNQSKRDPDFTRYYHFNLRRQIEKKYEADLRLWENLKALA